MSHGPSSDNSNHQPEKSDSKAGRIEKHAEQKAGGEASHGMEDHNKAIVAHIQHKRANRISGATKDGFQSADSLLPHEDQRKKSSHKSDKAPSQHQMTDGPSQPAKLEMPHHKTEAEQKKLDQPNFQRATEAATKALHSVINAGGGALNETHKFLKGMGAGEVEYVKELGDSLNVAGEYYGKALLGKANLGADIKEFSDAIGQTLGVAGDYYINQLPKGQANLGNDIGHASKAAADNWNALDSEQKGHFVGKEIVPLAVPGAVGIVAKEVQSANLVGKAGEAITALTSAEKLAQMEQKITQLQGHIQKIGELSKPLQPAYAAVTDGQGRPTVPFETPKIDDGILMKHGDKGLPQGVKPSERIVLSKIVSEEGHLVPNIEVPKEVYKAAEVQGFTKEQVQEKLQHIAKAVRDVYHQIGDYDPKIHGSERAYGNRFHEMLRQDLNKLNDKSINTETSFLKEKPSEWGKLGSSRVDIALGAKNEPFATVCLKTLKAVPSAQQERGWAKNLTRLNDGSIPPRLFLKIQKSLDN